MLIDDYFRQVLSAKRIRNIQRSLRPHKVYWERIYNLIYEWMSRREVYGTGMEVVITMDLVGLVKAGVNEIDKAKRELGLKIEKCDRGPAAFTVVFGQV